MSTSRNARGLIRTGRGVVFLTAMLASAGVAGTAGAKTITVNRFGAPDPNGCNLTDAVQAVVTSTKVHQCAAGDPVGTRGNSSGSDTISLQAGMYESYGKALVLTGAGGPVVIQGPSTDYTAAVIRASNFGYPTPNPASPDACPYPAAVFSGGTLTIQNLTLQANQDGTTGICQYAGALTVSHAVVGDEICPSTWGFNRGGIWSWPNTFELHRTLTVTSGALITGNYTFQNGGGIAAFGNVDVTLSSGPLGRPVIGCDTTESSGGGLAWGSDGSGKMGNLTISAADFQSNISYSWGGGLYLVGDDANATVTINSAITLNQASFTGGGIFIGSSVGFNKVHLTGGEIGNQNAAYQDAWQSSLNSDPNTYNAVFCSATSIESINGGSEWSGHNPPLKGDGTCVFP